MIKKIFEVEVIEGRTLVCNLDRTRNSDSLVIFTVREEQDQCLRLSFEEVRQLQTFLGTCISKTGGII